MHILIVEQDPDNGSILKSILEFYHHQPKLIPTAKEALNHLKYYHYDLILLDHFTCTREKLCRAFKNIDSKIIILSSIKGLEKDFKGVKIEASLKKPFNLDQFENILDNCI